MHFLSFITVDIENIKPPLMEGLDNLVAVRVFLVLLGVLLWLKSLIHWFFFLFLLFTENQGFGDKWPPWSKWFVNFLICHCYEWHCLTSLFTMLVLLMCYRKRSAPTTINSMVWFKISKEGKICIFPFVIERLFLVS